LSVEQVHTCVSLAEVTNDLRWKSERRSITMTSRPPAFQVADSGSAATPLRANPTALWLCADWETGDLSFPDQRLWDVELPTSSTPALARVGANVSILPTVPQCSWRTNTSTGHSARYRSRTENRLRDILDRCTAASDLPSEAETYRRRLVEIVWSSYGVVMDRRTAQREFQLSTGYLHPIQLKPYSEALWDYAVGLCGWGDADDVAGTAGAATRAITRAVQRTRIPHLSDKTDAFHAQVRMLIEVNYARTGHSASVPGL